MYTNILILFIILFILFIVLIINIYTIEPFKNNNSSYKNDSVYINQVKLLSNKYSDNSSQKRSVYELIKTFDEDDENMKSFVNFYSLGCRYAGFVGPMNDGYWDPDTAINFAVQAGCRTFILDIDYDDKYKDMFPRIVVRSTNNINQINEKSYIKKQEENSNIKYVCDKINTYTSSVNKLDPVIIVLHFLNVPPGPKDSVTVLDYFSNVAKGLSPFKSRLLRNVSNGNYDRQKQSDQLLVNNIEKYKESVLIFSNADTSGFCGKSYKADDDLDYLVNLRLDYVSPEDSDVSLSESSGVNSACITDRQISGIIQSDTFYINNNKSNIPESSKYKIINQNKKKWTICLSSNTSAPINKTGYDIISSYGVNCIPMMIFDEKNDFMTSDKLFKKYSFLPKPAELRYIKPPIIIPNPVDPKTNSNKGALAAPVVRI